MATHTNPATSDGNGGRGHQHHAQGPSPAQVSGSGSLTFTDQNRAHWDQFAAHYSAEPWQKKMINDITEFIIRNVNWIGVNFIDLATNFEKASDATPKLRVLDYACGPGTVTNALGNRATEYVGLDLSENMIKAYNARFTPEPGAEKIVAHGVVGNLLDEAGTPAYLDGEDFFNFDLAVVGLGFHHFENVELATKRLSDRLKPGGIFLVIDFAPHGHDREKHPAAHTVAHLGFGDDQIRNVFENVGLVEVEIVRMEGEVMMRGVSPRKVFMAKGRKK